MKHYASPRFWQLYHKLPPSVQQLAKKNDALLKANPRHGSLRFKAIKGRVGLWSVRVGRDHRALAIQKPEGYVWFWIGSHAEYDAVLKT